MKKIALLCLVASLCLLTACGKQAAARAERSKPRVSVTADNVQLRRAPAPNADIGADGGLKIDDIKVPVAAEQQAQLQSLYVQLQILRQNALTDAAPDPKMAPLPLQSTAQIDALRQQLLEGLPPLKPYQDSFTLLQAERH